MPFDGSAVSTHDEIAGVREARERGALANNQTDILPTSGFTQRYADRSYIALGAYWSDFGPWRGNSDAVWFIIRLAVRHERLFLSCKKQSSAVETARR
jgi:hypothetical protein